MGDRDTDRAGGRLTVNSLSQAGAKVMLVALQVGIG
jgi:hypothetical protein